MTLWSEDYQVLRYDFMISALVIIGAAWVSWYFRARAGKLSIGMSPSVAYNFAGR